MSRALAYPDAPTSDHVDSYHGTTVRDAFRPLEDVDAVETRAWLAAQEALTESFLAAIPARERLRTRLTQLWNYERFGLPARIGTRYLYAKNTGLQPQSVVYLAETLGGPARVLIDPNAFSADGTVALSGTAASDDGRYLAYATSGSGSDWLTWRIRDVVSGEDLEDEIRWSKFSGATWRRDGSGFYYARYAEPDAATQFKGENYNQQIWFHALGSTQAEDQLVYERPDHPDWTFGTVLSDDGRWLIINAHRGTEPNNRVFALDLHEAMAPAVDVLVDGEAQYAFAGNDGETFYFATTLDAPRRRLIAFDLRDRSIREIVPEAADLLEDVALFGDTFVLSYLRDAHAAVVRYDLSGRALGEVALPGLGTTGGFGGKRRNDETFFAFTSYTRPTSIYRLVPSTGEVALVFAPTVPFDTSAFVSEQHFYTSKDGTRVPIIVTSRRDLARDGTHPTVLYGYGGFNISVTPAFSPAIVAWLEAGGIFAAANLRGGGEYGEDWHRAGTFERKQNVFDDCIAAAEFLIEAGYTSTPRLAVSGGSNGGLLVGACITQRPDLFGAAVAAVGVFDMLRFQKFTIGWAWTADYGSSDDPDAFTYLRAYSPLHNVRDGVAYPATLIETADHDDRVYPAHSFKFAAELQRAQGGPAPILLRVERKAGHGAGRSTQKMIDEAADRYAFLMKVLGVDDTETRA